MKTVKTFWHKILLAGVGMAVLVGCGSADASDLGSAAKRQIDAVTTAPVLMPSYTHHFYDYYAMPSIGRLGSSRTGNVFSLDGTRFIMNLNVNAVLCDAYYQNVTENDSLNDILPETRFTGTYVDYAGETHAYTVAIYLMGEQYYTFVSAGAMDFAALSNAAQAPYLAGEMMRIARTIRLHPEAVLSAFSNQEAVIANTRKRVDLFHDLAPESGVIEELFEHTTIQGETPSETIENETEPAANDGGDLSEAN